MTEKDVKNLGVSSRKGHRKVITVIPKENNIIEDDYQILITRFATFFKSKSKVIKRIGCESTVLLMTVKYIDQCNLEFNDTILKLISDSFDEFYITCYEVETFK